jgi:phosphatidylserine/phosphatidylglycerophosphate/cardiolipin synthase-like enzyme
LGTLNVPPPPGWYAAAGNFKILRKIEGAIRNTRPTKRRPRPTIYIATYLLDRPQSVDALIAACRRGVSVSVVLDEDISSRPSRRLMRVLNADNVKHNSSKRGHSVPKRGPCDTKLKKDKKKDKKDKKKHKGKKGKKAKGKAKRAKNPLRASRTWGKDRSYVKKCNGACRGGSGGNMHSKFFAFSRTGKARHVVMVSSSNLNRGGATLGWNDMYTMRNRPKSYQVYARVHRGMTRDRRTKAHKVEVRDGPYTSRFFPMRRATKRTDPTFRDLGKVTCRSAVGPTRIYVSMFYWKGPRGNYLATRLLDLARRGCKVNVVYGAPSVQIAERLRNAARARRIMLYDSRWDHDGDGWNEVRTHSKYVLVKGTFGKKRRARVVMTGSQNWVSGSLTRGDENTLNIAKKGVYQQYVKHWNNIRKHSRRLPYRW